MKKHLFILLLAALAAGCTSHPKEKEESPRTATTAGEKTEEGRFPRASHIFWIDMDKSKDYNGKKIRNVKVRAQIEKDGKVKVLEYEKEQHFMVTDKIDKCLRTFRVKADWLESGKVKTGEQIIFLRLSDEY